MDGYLKNVKNYIVIDKANGATYSNPNIRGIDVFLKKDMPLGTLFGSYSLNAGSPQTQNVAHEAKIGGMIKLGRFVLSSDYVFSTGYNDLALPMGPSEFGGEGGMGKQHFDNDITVGGNYSRWDIGANYRKRFRHFSLSSSISFINILNTSNTKYSSSTNLQDKTLTLFSQSSKFTPVLLFEIIF